MIKLNKKLLSTLLLTLVSTAALLAACAEDDKSGGSLELKLDKESAKNFTYLDGILKNNAPTTPLSDSEKDTGDAAERFAKFNIVKKDATYVYFAVPIAKYNRDNDFVTNTVISVDADADTIAKAFLTELESPTEKNTSPKAAPVLLAEEAITVNGDNTPGYETVSYECRTPGKNKVTCSFGGKIWYDSVKANAAEGIEAATGESIASKITPVAKTMKFQVISFADDEAVLDALKKATADLGITGEQDKDLPAIADAYNAFIASADKSSISLTVETVLAGDPEDAE